MHENSFFFFFKNKKEKTVNFSIYPVHYFLNRLLFKNSFQYNQLSKTSLLPQGDKKKFLNN